MGTPLTRSEQIVLAQKTLKQSRDTLRLLGAQQNELRQIEQKIRTCVDDITKLKDTLDAAVLTLQEVKTLHAERKGKWND